MQADKEKPKKQRRKPAIPSPAEVEPAITELPDQEEQVDVASEQLAAALDNEREDLDEEEEEDEGHDQGQGEPAVSKPHNRRTVKAEVKQDQEEDEDPVATPRQRYLPLFEHNSLAHVANADWMMSNNETGKAVKAICVSCLPMGGHEISKTLCTPSSNGAAVGHCPCLQ